MTRHSCTTSVLALFSAATLAASQQPQRPTPQIHDPITLPAAPAAGRATMTFVGCLYREAQVPGRTPNVAERAGVLEDYILADATLPAGQSQRGSTPGATGTSGNTETGGQMYKVENIPDERLRTLVGKRVEVSGRIDPEGLPAPIGTSGTRRTATPDRGLGPDAISLPELEASSIREIAGTCPSTPAVRQ